MLHGTRLLATYTVRSIAVNVVGNVNELACSLHRHYVWPTSCFLDFSNGSFSNTTNFANCVSFVNLTTSLALPQPGQCVSLHTYTIYIPFCTPAPDK
jgi:hypothetical protein